MMSLPAGMRSRLRPAPNPRARRKSRHAQRQLKVVVATINDSSDDESSGRTFSIRRSNRYGYSEREVRPSCHFEYQVIAACWSVDLLARHLHDRQAASVTPTSQTPFFPGWARLSLVPQADTDLYQNYSPLFAQRVVFFLPERPTTLWKCGN